MVRPFDVSAGRMFIGESECLPDRPSTQAVRGRQMRVRTSEKQREDTGCANARRQHPRSFDGVRASLSVHLSPERHDRPD